MKTNSVPKEASSLRNIDAALIPPPPQACESQLTVRYIPADGCRLTQEVLLDKDRLPQLTPWSICPRCEALGFRCFVSDHPCMPLRAVPADGCKATQEVLLDKGSVPQLTLNSACPRCEGLGFRCFVSDHPRQEPFAVGESRMS